MYLRGACEDTSAPRMELLVAVNCHMVAEKQTWDLCKSRQRS